MIAEAWPCGRIRRSRAAAILAAAMAVLLAGIPFVAGCGGLGEPSDPPDGPSSGGSGGGIVDASCEGRGSPSNTTLRAMFEAVNVYRTENGVGTLAYSTRLEAAAEAHAQDMYLRSFFDHENPDGEYAADRAMRFGFCHEYVGENIAAGYGSVAEVQAAWQASPGHNANLLDARYDLVGMGHYVAPTGRQYWVQVFALADF